jgi:hypothetical protein
MTEIRPQAGDVLVWNGIVASVPPTLENRLVASASADAAGRRVDHDRSDDSGDEKRSDEPAHAN